MALFRTERDVRDAVKKLFGDRLFWVEPAPGSTVGLPDCFVVEDDGGVTFLELKLGRKLNSGEIRYRVRPEQRLTIRRMLAAGARVMMVVGVKGSLDLHSRKPSDEVLRGRCSSDQSGDL